jgi:hypothetical protein
MVPIWKAGGDINPKLGRKPKQRHSPVTVEAPGVAKLSPGVVHTKTLDSVEDCCLARNSR